MKRVRKSDEPPSLRDFRCSRPGASWDEMRGDAHFGGMRAYDDVRDTTARDQGGLCAYCEIEIDPANALRIRVEHFHSKADIQPGAINWALHWPNMLAVCLGGGNPALGAPHFAKPLQLNLSCDSHKARFEHIGKLAIPCDGDVLNPLLAPANPSLFKYLHSDGKLEPDPVACSATVIAGNRHASTEALVARTIEVFNLNCPRLRDARRTVAWAIEHDKKMARSEGLPAPQGLARIAERRLARRFPQLLTTVRACLGQAAETYLQGIQYNG